MLDKKNQVALAAARRSFGFGALIATALLLAALTAAAATNYTGTGWVTDIPVAPILCTNGSGQVLFRASVHTVRVQTDEPRTTGRRQVFVDGVYQSDGSALIWGSLYQEVGTWDGTGTNFTATGGLWELNYRTVMPADNSLNFTAVGVGYGGAIDGLRLEETIMRTNTLYPIDPAIPYLYAGTIKPPPLNTNQMLDNFDDNILQDWSVYGSGQFYNTNAQLTVRGYYPGVHTTSILDSYVLGAHSTQWTVPNGQTREWRVDLVGLDENATNTAILSVGMTSGLYAVHKGRDYMYILKWPTPTGMSVFACEKATVRNTNAVLALALTRVQPNLLITARVLDKADPNTVLYQCAVVDTPSVDPTLSRAEFQALTGMNLLDLGPDAAHVPFTLFSAGVGVFQYTSGSSPAVLATFDNLELRTSEVPGIGIERAMRLCWPVSSTINYAVYAAPTVQGPWLPVYETTPTGMNQMTLPADELMKFFQLLQAP